MLRFQSTYNLNMLLQVFNSLYVGMMVLALARTKDNLSQRMKTLTR